MSQVEPNWGNENKTMYRSDGSDGRREKDLLTLSVSTRREVLSY